MNSIDLRTEKANAIFKYKSFHTLTTLFRCMEIIIFVVIITTYSYQSLPFNVRVSADVFKGISFAWLSPRFVFVVGNVIVLTLLYKSRVPEDGEQYGKIDVYDECVRRCEKSGVVVRDKKICRSQSEKKMSVECNDSERHRKLMRSVTERRMSKKVDCCGGEKPSLEICRSVPSCWTQGQRVCCWPGSDEERGIRSQSEKTMSVESHQKVTLSVTESKYLKEISRSEQENIKKSMEYNDNDQNQRKLLPEICRSQSEKVMRVECTGSENHRKLTRSVTDCCDGKTPRLERNVDDLSNEAFRRTVEAFIARQQQSLRDEELAPIPFVHEVNNIFIS